MATMTKERTQTAQQPRRPKIGRNLTPYMYIIPALLIMTIITYYPMGTISGCRLPITASRICARMRPRPITWVFKITLTFSPAPWRFQILIFGNTLGFNLFWTFSNVIFPCFHRHHHRSHSQYAWVMVSWHLSRHFCVPIVIPTLVVGTVWRNMFDADYGAINQMLTWVAGLMNLPPVQSAVD